jgi:hypothetical protein
MRYPVLTGSGSIETVLMDVPELFAAGNVLSIAFEFDTEQQALI